MNSIDLSDETKNVTVVSRINARIATAYEAQNNAKSEWGKNYWSVVLAYLLRQANRLN